MHSNNTAFLFPHSHTFNFLTSCFTSLCVCVCVCVCPLTTYWPLKLSSLKKTQKTMFCLSLSILVQFEWLPLLCFPVFWSIPLYDPTYCSCLLLYLKILLLCSSIPFDSCLYFLSVRLLAEQCIVLYEDI